MYTIIAVMVLTAFFGGALWRLGIEDGIKKPLKKGDGKRIYIVIVLLVGLIARVIAAMSYYGHKTDMGCFISWSDRIFNNGLSQFYISDGFHDYPPGYVYVMYVLGAIKNIFNIENESLWLLIKMPAIIADLLMGGLVYNTLSKRYTSEVSTAIASLVIFNPTVILNSSIWGQVDSILAVVCVISVYLASRHKLTASFFMLAAGILVKPQAVFVAPVILFALIEQEFLAEGFNRKRFSKTVLGALGAVLAMLVLFMPFGNNPVHGISVIINQYIDTMQQYNHMTVNAFNIYGALGQNWTDLTPVVSVIGYIFIMVVVAISAYVFFKSKSPARYYISAFILFFGIYMFSVKMHERYAFPAIFMLIMAVAVAPNIKNAIMYGLFSLSQFFNIAWILFVYEKDPNEYFKSPIIVIASIINIILVIVFAYIIKKEYVEVRNDEMVIPEKKKETPVEKVMIPEKPKMRLSEKLEKITLFDIVAIAVITAVYAGIAFYNLGSRYAPQTETVISDGAVTVDLGGEKTVSETAFFLGARQLKDEKALSFSYYDNNNNLVKEETVSKGSVFVWTMLEDTDVRARYVKVSTDAVPKESDPTDKIYLKELCLLDTMGNTITPVNTSDERVGALFDEQDYMPQGKSFMHGTYFDEIYHPRTAYEFIHKMSVYEWTHPPLGKVFISMGIKMFGMTPFGWRFIGTLFGVFMVCAVYLFARRVLKYKWLALFACLLFTFDFMHFAQTRLATIDTYVTFFIMLMYYYMYKYCSQSFYDTPLKKTFIPLGLSGVFFGLAVASKWTGLYAGAGLAIIFFKSLYDRYKDYKSAAKNITSQTLGISNREIVEKFKQNSVRTILFCCVMFIAVPAIIYALSYIPYINTPSGDGIKTIFKNAQDMLTYHGKTVVSSTHPYSSYWYEWPVMYRPIWYFSNTLDNGLKQGISAFGNPAVWWVGIAAVAYCLALAIIIPLRDKGYFGKSKKIFAISYAIIFVILTIAAGVTASSDEKYVRLLPCMILYSSIFIGAFLLVLANEKHLKNISASVAAFLVIGYFTNLLPWTFVLRITYIYHYFPCVVFVVLMICYSIKTIYDNVNNKKAVIAAAAAYVVIALILFALFYPVLSGHPIGEQFADTWLKWFKSWVLV